MTFSQLSVEVIDPYCPSNPEYVWLVVNSPGEIVPVLTFTGECESCRLFAAQIGAAAGNIPPIKRIPYKHLNGGEARQKGYDKKHTVPEFLLITYFFVERSKW